MEKKRRGGMGEILHLHPFWILFETMITHVVPVKRQIILTRTEIAHHGVASVHHRIGDLACAVSLFYYLYSVKRVGRTGHAFLRDVPTEKIPISGFLESKLNATFIHDVVPSYAFQFRHLHAASDLIHLIESITDTSLLEVDLRIVEQELGKTPRMQFWELP